MTQIFVPSADTWLRLSLIIFVLMVIGAFLVGGGVVRSDYVTWVGHAVDQPVPFSHQHHVGGLGIDCRYCHLSVETSSNAGFPPTHVCMTCHSEIWTGAQVLEPVRQSLAEDRPLHWNRVTTLPDFVYFNHSIHITNGVGCETCHGRVDQMPRIWRTEPFLMKWCLDCHTDPAPHLRPREAVFDMGWQPPPGTDRRALGERLIAAYHIPVAGRANLSLTHCYTCHR